MTKQQPAVEQPAQPREGSFRRGKVRSAQLTVHDVRVAGFSPCAPVLIECVSGPAAGKRLVLPARSWGSNAIAVDENLRTVSRKSAQSGCVLMTSGGGPVSIRALNEQSEVWVVAGAVAGGCGVVRVDERVRMLRVHGHKLRVDAGAPEHAPQTAACGNPNSADGRERTDGSGVGSSPCSRADGAPLLPQRYRGDSSSGLLFDLGRRCGLLRATAARRDGVRSGTRTGGSDDPRFVHGDASDVEEGSGAYGVELAAIDSGEGPRTQWPDDERWQRHEATPLRAAETPAGTPRSGGSARPLRTTRFRETTTFITEWTERREERCASAADIETGRRQRGGGGEAGAGGGGAAGFVAAEGESVVGGDSLLSSHSSSRPAATRRRTTRVLEEEVALKSTPVRAPCTWAGILCRRRCMRMPFPLSVSLPSRPHAARHASTCPPVAHNLTTPRRPFLALPALPAPLTLSPFRPPFRLPPPSPPFALNSDRSARTARRAEHWQRWRASRSPPTDLLG